MIGDQIKRYRLQKTMTLSELAEKSNIAKSYLSSIERNLQTNPSITVIEKLASVLDISVNTLVHGEMAETTIDSEWEELVMQAMNSGISKKEFREFVEFNKWKMNHK
ncbi:helix-turn-helix domain-containing protein [Sporosarcina sp. NPDC096371]|uniref:helix-turn-helix domain-containing protein n=1 Tax=Sporosarcina sp. NPDC096371 TaxID=3364530 RepID=UPI0038230B2A